MSPETVSDLKDLKPPIDRSLADRLLLLTRAGRSLPSDCSRGRMRRVEWREVEGQETLVDVEPSIRRTPPQTVELIVEWLRAVLRGRRPVSLPEPTGAMVGRLPRWSDDSRASGAARPQWAVRHRDDARGG